MDLTMCDLPSQPTRCPLAILGKRQIFFLLFLFLKLQSLHKECGEVVVAQLVDTSSRDLLHFTLYFAFFFSFLIFLFQSLFTFDWLVLVVWVKQHAVTHVPSPQETFLGRKIDPHQWLLQNNIYWMGFQWSVD